MKEGNEYTLQKQKKDLMIVQFSIIGNQIGSRISKDWESNIRYEINYLKQVELN